MRKLYQPMIEIPTKEHGDANCYVLVIWRQESLFPPDEMIQDFQSLSADEKFEIPEFLKTLFTEDEIEALEAYMLEKYGLQIISKSIILPIQKDCALLDAKEGEEELVMVPLDEAPGYSLPFKVWALRR